MMHLQLTTAHAPLMSNNNKTNTANNTLGQQQCAANATDTTSGRLPVGFI